jgi:SAM-dependent methyltransferase
VEEDWRTLNLANWEERVGIHLGDGGYDLSSHRAGAGRLDAIVAAELGPLAGLRVLHLQCHIGHDTVALAHKGAAEVVGVDFSPTAIAAARALAEQCGVGSATFVHSDVYTAPDALAGQHGRFDLVFTTWGTICWLPDLDGWARVVRHFLKPGGVFYFADAHPTALVFDDVGGSRDAKGRPGWLVPYFERAPQQFDEATDYADPTARLTNTRTVQWMHPLADIVAALHGASLRTEWLHEHPRVTWRMFSCLVRDEDGLWAWPDRPWLPLALSLRAVAV